jgi:choline dehydrogenase-like flavoprotein
VSLTDRKDGFDLPIATVRHEYTDADVRRRDALVRTARKILRRAGGLVGKMRLIDSFSHAVGTARFATTPDAGALSPECRVWAYPNLFVVDGSFMPTSGGVNPSLTITANAFRVAAHIRREFGAIAGA